MLLILWTGTDDFDVCNGSLEDAIQDVKDELNTFKAFPTYERTGAVIINAEAVYSINLEGKEGGGQDALSRLQ